MEKLYYAEINVFCILLLVGIALTLYHHDRSILAKYLIYFMLSEAILFLADFAWFMIDGNTAVPIWVNYVLNAVYFSFTVLCPFVAFRYFYYSVSEKELPQKVDAISLIPAALVIIESVLAFKNHALFYVNSANVYTRGPLYLIQPVVSYLYMLLGTGFCLYSFFTRKSSFTKNRSKTLALYSFFPIICGVLEIIFPNVPILCVGMTFSIVLMTFNLQMDHVTHDLLTGISNRHSLTDYLEQLISQKRQLEKANICVSFIDADNFKSINDRFGHAEGDKALRAIAKGLKDACRPQSAYCARYAGDEFVVVYKAETDEEAESFNESIKDCVVEAGIGLPYALTVSSGWARLTQEIKTPHELLRIADQKMYSDKKYGKEIPTP